MPREGEEGAGSTGRRGTMEMRFGDD